MIVAPKIDRFANPLLEIDGFGRTRYDDITEMFKEISELKLKWISEVACALKLRCLSVLCRITQPLKSESLNFKNQNGEL